MSDDVPDLAAGFRELTSMLLSDETLATTLERVVTVATRFLPPGCAASVVLLRGGVPRTEHASDQRATSVDERQLEFVAGPCIEAIKTGEVQMSAEVGSDERWPEVGAVAVACGVRSVLSAPLVVRGEVAGALNIYSDRPGVFTDDARASAALLAAQAAVAVANAAVHEECLGRIEQLQEALDSRVVIEQAKGILMERNRCRPDAAFDVLREVSQRENRRLRAVAADVVAAVSGSG